MAAASAHPCTHALNWTVNELGVEAINLGFATDCNTSGYKFYIEGTRKIITSNQGKFDELVYPYRNRNMIDKHIDDLSNIDVLTLDQGGITWVNYSKDMDLNQNEKVHSGSSNVYGYQARRFLQVTVAQARR